MNWVPDGDDSYWNCDYIEPTLEYIRIFYPNALRQKEAYTYISRPYLVLIKGADIDPEPDISDIEWAIGWWKYDPNAFYDELILADEPDDSLQVKEPVTFAPGAGFFGYFFDSHSVRINFPAATDVKPKE